MSGKEGAQAERMKAFAEELRERFGLPVHLWDERLTSAEANRVLGLISRRRWLQRLSRRRWEHAIQPRLIGLCVEPAQHLRVALRRSQGRAPGRVVRRRVGLEARRVRRSRPLWRRRVLLGE